MISRSRRHASTAFLLTFLLMLGGLAAPLGRVADAGAVEAPTGSAEGVLPSPDAVDDPLRPAMSPAGATSWSGALPAPLPNTSDFTAEPAPLPEGSFETQIIGGGTATRVPTGSIVRIIYGIAPSFTCSGTLVAAQWVLTAGHCLVQYGADDRPIRVANNPAGYSVYFGASLSSPVSVVEVRLSDGYLLRNSAEDVPGYRLQNGSWQTGTANLANDTGLDDFGLLKLAAPVAAAPVPLAVDDHLAQSGRTVWAAGWGLTSSGTQPATLQEAAMTMANSTYCEIAWRSYFSAPSNACFIGTTTATCNGDSGGPVMSQDDKGVWWLVAIISGGAAGCPVNSPYLGPRSQWMANWVAQQTGQAQNGRSGESFNPVPPTRIVDSRSAQGVSFIPPTVYEPSSLGIYLPTPTLPTGFVTRRPITGSNGVSGLPGSGVAGVALNVTVDRPKAAGYVAVYPCTDGWTGTSSVNFGPNQTVANMVVTKVDRNGDICIRAAMETAVIVDVTGWFGPPVAPDVERSVKSADPVRLWDSRTTPSTPPLAAGTVKRLKVTGGAGRPPEGAKAVVLNVTATGTTAPGFVTVYPCDQGLPGVSNLNPVPGRDVPNSVMVGIQVATGEVCLYTAQPTHLVVDLNGWVVNGAGKAKTVTPARAADTRTLHPRWPSTATFIVQMAGNYGLPAAAGLDAVLLNVTVDDAAAPGFLVAFPCAALPASSNLNFVPGLTVANAVMAKVDAAGRVCLRANADADIIVDVNGYVAK